MKRVDVVIAGLIIVGVFGCVLAGQIVLPVSLASAGGDDILVGSCTGISIGGTEKYCENKNITQSACNKGKPSTNYVDCTCVPKQNHKHQVIECGSVYSGSCSGYTGYKKMPEGMLYGYYSQPDCPKVGQQACIPTFDGKSCEDSSYSLDDKPCGGTKAEGSGC